MVFSLIYQCQLSILNAQEEENTPLFYENHIYKESIHTPILCRSGAEMTYPILYLNSIETLTLSFDDFTDETSQYYYTIYHCNSDWKPTQISQMEYIDGFIENPVTKFQYSFNTLQPYVHYDLIFPNENMKPKISGNYLLLVYEDSDTSLKVLTKRFMITEAMTEIKPIVKRATQIDKMKSHQEVDFNLVNSFNCRDPFQEIKPVILQNGNWNLAVKGLKPLYVKEDELIYDYEEENIFGGGSEFRYVDIKSVRYQSDRVAKLEYVKPIFHVSIVTDEPRRFKVYLNWQDIDGKFLIKNSDANESSTEADYVMLHFSLKTYKPYVQGKIYVNGWFNDWSTDEKYELKYNEAEDAYTGEALVKQGYYNYLYAFVDSSGVPDYSMIEGNHYETENEYLILVYYHPFASQYERLTGYKIINSNNVVFKF